MTTLTEQNITVEVTTIFPRVVAEIIAGSTSYTCATCKNDVMCAANLSPYGICRDCAHSICISCDAKNPGDWGVDNSCLECRHYICNECTYKFLRFETHSACIDGCEEGNDSGTLITWYEHEYCWTHCPPKESDEEISTSSSESDNEASSSNDDK